MIIIILVSFVLLTLFAEYLKCQNPFDLKKTVLSLSFLKNGIINAFFSTVLFMTVYSDFFAPLNLTPQKLLIYFAISVLVAVFPAWLSLYKRTNKAKRILFATIVCLLGVISSEIFIFNSRALESAEYKPVPLYEMGSITADEKINSHTFTVKKGGSVTFEIDGMDLDIENLHINTVAYKHDKNNNMEELPVIVKIAATDAANALYITGIPNRVIYPQSKSSQYIPMQLSGSSDKLRITFTPEGSVAADIYIKEITANSPKPFEVNRSRILILFAVAMIVYLIVPTSPIYGIRFKHSFIQTAVTCCVIAIEIIAVFSIIATSGHFLQLLARHQAQYQELSESFLNGHLYLEKEVPKFLMEMENPYDYALRKSMGQSFYWDAAYYNGHYYVYFGVVPVLLLYLPYFLLTGTHLANDMAIFIFAVFFIIGCFALVRRIIRRYFPDKNIPYLVYLIVSLMFVNGSGLLYMASYADMYSVPILAALAFTVCGLSLWLAALEQKRFRLLRLIFGSLCMALVAGCRPNLLLFSFLVIPFFFAEVVKAFKEKRVFKGESIGNFISFAMPYVVVAVAIMWYNHARFGSPFDFGANYNLTTNDMTSRGFVWDRILPAAYSYLLQWPKYISVFPFIRFSDFDTSYMGVTIRETTYGGIFSYSPFLLLVIAIPFIRKFLAEHKVLLPASMLAVCGIITPLFDAQFAGILQRYFADFSLMLYMSAAFVFFAILAAVKNDSHKKAVYTGLFICFIAMVGYQGALLMRKYALSDVLPFLFWY